MRTDDLVDTYQVEAVATFDEQTIEDFAEKSIELPVVTQSTEEELNEQADDVSFVRILTKRMLNKRNQLTK